MTPSPTLNRRRLFKCRISPLCVILLTWWPTRKQPTFGEKNMRRVFLHLDIGGKRRWVLLSEIKKTLTFKLCHMMLLLPTPPKNWLLGFLFLLLNEKWVQRFFFTELSSQCESWRDPYKKRTSVAFLVGEPVVAFFLIATVICRDFSGNTGLPNA